MHRIETRLYRIPIGERVFLPQAVEDPEEKSDRKVAIIRPMSNNVTTTDIISEMEMIVAHEKVITERTRPSSSTRTILRKPYRKISLTAKRIVSEMINEVI